MKRCTYRLTVAYDGSAFAGFMPVPGERSVWTVVRDALISVAPALSKLAAAARTDRGVHALGQVFSFVTRDPVDEAEVLRAIDAAAPGALAAGELRRVSDSFHAQFSAGGRRYVYLLEDGEGVDVARVDRLLCALLGKRCFNAFARDTPPGKKTIKTLIEARARRIDRSTIRFDFAADAFLRRQIRVIVATALREAARGAGDDALVELAATRDRRATANPAPAGGLYLVKVSYDPISKRKS